MSFAQGTPSVNTLINSSNTVVYGNTSSGTALSVQQLGSGSVMNVATSTGTSALFVNSSGNVGVGTTDPQGPIHSYTTRLGYPDSSGSGTSNVVARIQSGSICLDFGSIGGTNPFWIQNHLNTAWNTTYPILLNPNGGNVGIGTTNPNATLDVRGTSNILAPTNSGAALYVNGNPNQFGLDSLIKITTTGGNQNGSSPYLNRAFLELQSNTTQGNYGYNMVSVTRDVGTVGEKMYSYINGSGSAYFAGNVGIGTASPGYITEISNSTSSTSTSFLGLTNPYAFGFNTGLNIGSSIVYSSRWQGDGLSGIVEMCKIDGRKENSANYGDSYLAFQTRYETNRGAGGAGTLTEKMRISGIGNVGIGVTNPSAPFHVYGVSGTSQQTTIINSGGISSGDVLQVLKQYTGNFCLRLDSIPNSYTAQFIYFATNNQGTNPGSITATNSTTMVYGSSSDYRIKSNVVPLSNSIEFVNKLRPVNFTFNANPETVVGGFIAHEVQELIPYSVTGEKDGMKPDGTMNIQNVDKSYIIPYLTAAIQELSAENTVLKARLDSLEARLAVLESK